MKNPRETQVTLRLPDVYADALRTETARRIAAAGGVSIHANEVAKRLLMDALMPTAPKPAAAPAPPVQPLLIPTTDASDLADFTVIAADVAKHGKIVGTVLEFRERFRGITGLDGKGAAQWLASRARRAGVQCATVGHKYVSAKDRFATHGAYAVYSLTRAA